MIHLLKMVIVHSYLKLPAGKLLKSPDILVIRSYSKIMGVYNQHIHIHIYIPYYHILSHHLTMIPSFSPSFKHHTAIVVPSFSHRFPIVFPHLPHPIPPRALLRRAEPMPPSTSTAGTPSSAQSRSTAPLSPGAGEGSTTQEGAGSSL
jgi:hypothetical protein